MGISLGGVGVGASVPLEDIRTEVLVTLLRETGGVPGSTQAMAIGEGTRG